MLLMEFMEKSLVFMKIAVTREGMKQAHEICETMEHAAGNRTEFVVRETQTRKMIKWKEVDVVLKGCEAVKTSKVIRIDGFQVV